jgi:hypothetical protein
MSFQTTTAHVTAGLHAVLVPVEAYHLLCFSEHATLPGPRRLTQSEIRSSFEHG